MLSPSDLWSFEDHQANDHISNLPDAILGHILSFVPTSSAVRTSVLSKRWKFVWTKVPTLDFTEMPYTGPGGLTSVQRNYFKSFVDKVLVHNEVSHLRRVYFNVMPEIDDFYIKSWISAITRRDVRQIKINFQLRTYTWRVDYLVLPPQMLSCERLVVLKLDGLFAFDTPKSLHLPNLETIHLSGVEFPDDEFMKKLLSGCPVLKQLRIVDCRGIVSKFYVESLTLKSLEIYSCSRWPTGCIVIKAPSIRYLALKVKLAEYDIDDLTSLVEANFNLYLGDYELAFQLLRKVSGVETLRFVTYECDRSYRSKLPIFRNLTCLKVDCDDYTFEILKCATNLKSVIFESVRNACYISYESESPKCLSRLESVELYCELDEDEDMMKLVAYILKEALVLKEMIIHMHKIHDPECFYKKLLMFRRSSSACQVKVVPWRLTLRID